jgi:hypothetical protein
MRGAALQDRQSDVVIFLARFRLAFRRHMTRLRNSSALILRSNSCISPHPGITVAKTCRHISLGRLSGHDRWSSACRRIALLTVGSPRLPDFRGCGGRRRRRAAATRVFIRESLNESPCCSISWRAKQSSSDSISVGIAGKGRRRLAGFTGVGVGNIGGDIGGMEVLPSGASILLCVSFSRRIGGACQFATCNHY